MRVSLLLSLVVLSLLSLSVVDGLPDDVTHVVDAMEQHQLDHDIQQPTGAPTRTTPTRTTTRPTTTPSRTPTPSTPRSPRSPRTGMMFPRNRMTDPFRFRMRMDPDVGLGISPRLTRLSMFERRMLRRMFRQMLRVRMRELYGDDYPMSRWEMRVIRMMVLRDMMMAMDVQAQDAAELVTMMEQRETDMDESETENYDDITETESEIQSEAEIESEHDIEAMPEDTLVEGETEIDPTLIESEFDISAPYGGGYGGYGNFGGGYGGGKKGGYSGKKVPYKKVPYKKVPYPPKKSGGFGFGFGGYGGGKKGGGFY